tara:strand:+ start:966 stop:1697 length:732 start_codon:yes stop_codon:yes gene_type:complete
MKDIIRKIKKLLTLMPIKLYRDAIFHGVAAAIEHEKLLSNNSYKTIVDIGANRGQFSLVARKVYPDSSIYSFDPLDNAKATFKKVFFNDVNTHFFNYAIGPSSGKEVIHISKKDDSSSLLPIGKLQSELFPGTEESKTSLIKISPLENLINKRDIVGPALLKLDVQGFEYEALLGCKNLLEMFDDIYCECSYVELYSKQKLADDVIDLLKNYGFYLHSSHNTSYDKNGEAIQSDILFKKDILS